MNTLKAEHLVKSYKGRTVVNGASLEVSSGEAVGLLGPNGAGKTTSFYMIVGLIQPDQGRIILNGEDLTHRPMHVRARSGLGYLPQDASVFRKMTVEENILAILQTQPDLDKQSQHQRMEELLEELNIGHIRTNRGMSLSGGERRRVEIARALAVTPKFILLDEPFAGVDPISVMDIQKLIKQLCAKGIGVLITDHNVRETLGICGRAYIINNGEVLTNGTPDEIISNDQVRDVYLGRDFSL